MGAILKLFYDSIWSISLRYHPDTLLHHPDALLHHPDALLHHPDALLHHPDALLLELPNKFGTNLLGNSTSF
ncbi:hypothetical protein V2611_10660 [Tenacibaculum maritimum]|uniref:hypothetical protein n=1 Tax=Tenacibaculum maritimum TaxID=107401 RepID=UPI0038777D93